jgi:hypothetical protein
MRILYRDPETSALTITGVSNTKYLPDEGMLVFFGDDDVMIAVTQHTADNMVLELFTKGVLDITEHLCTYYDWDEEDDDDDDDMEFVFEPTFLKDL